jgi:hypothetical protein
VKVNSLLTCLTLAAIVLVNRDNNDSPDPEMGSDSASDLSGSESLSLQSTASSEDKPEIPVLQRYYDEIVSIVDKLFDISILIRGATRRFQASRAAIHVEKDDALEEFKRIVFLKIKGLFPDTPVDLAKRLTKVIGMRRQQFYYQRAHRKRLGKAAGNFQDVAHIEWKPIESSIPITEVSKTKASMMKSQLPTSPKTTRSVTTWKETVATDLRSVLDEEPGTPTLVNLAPSERRGGENIFPAPPKEPRGKAFECNQCFLILPEIMRKKVEWR